MFGITTAWLIPAPSTLTCAACGRSWARRRNISIRYAASATAFSRLDPKDVQVWPILSILLFAALLMVHLGWRRKFRRTELHLQSEVDQLRRDQDQSTTQIRARQEALFNSMA